MRLDQRIERATALPESDRAWMHTHLAQLRQRWQHRPGGLADCVIHGDAWVGNVVATTPEPGSGTRPDDSSSEVPDSHVRGGQPGGRVMFLDLERSSIGPPEWDLVHTAIKHYSFDWITNTDYQDFRDTYGHDVTDWAGYELFRDIREFRMTCMAAQTATENPDTHPQATHRLACLQGRHGPRPWPGWTTLP